MKIPVGTKIRMGPSRAKSNHGRFHGTGKLSLTIAAKPDGVEAASQPLIARDEQSWIADAHCGDGKHFVVRADEKLRAFLELEAAICVSLLTEQIYRDVGFHRLVTRHWDRKSAHGCHSIVT